MWPADSLLPTSEMMQKKKSDHLAWEVRLGKDV